MLLKLKSYINSVITSILLLAFVVVGILPYSKVYAATGSTYYISTSGNDTNPGTLSSPWKTIGKASSMVAAGDTVFIRGGVYNETVKFSNSGTASSPIWIKAYSGENPIIDGNLTFPGYGSYLLDIRGSYINVSGIEVRNSGYGGIFVAGNYDLIDNVFVHNDLGGGIIISQGQHSTVQNSRIWKNSMANEYGKAGTWGSGLSAARLGVTYATIRHNTVWENWGEGISSFEANQVIIEDNISHDNFTANIYISDSTNVLCQRNFAYMDTGSYAYGYGSNVGIMMGDEKSTPKSAYITVINNIAYGNHRNFHWWKGQGNGMDNVLIANNTFVNGTGSSSNGEGGVIIGAGTHINSNFYNNLVVQDGTSLPAIATISQPGITYSHNLWSKTPLSAASGVGDVIGDPLLSKVGTPFSADWYRLTNASPAIASGTVSSNVTSDYFGTARDGSPDIGANETTFGPVTTPTMTYIPTSTKTNTPTTTKTNTPTSTKTNTPTSTKTNTPTSTKTNTPTSTKTYTPTSTKTSTPTFTPRLPVGYGTYDERSAEIEYTGSWMAQSISGNYANTEKYSTMVGSSARFTFTGENISVIYRGYPNVFGNMEVRIDGTVVTTINQNTTIQTLQKRWSSGNLGTGTHTLTLTHLTGIYVTLDAIIVSGPSTATPTATVTYTPTITKTPINTLTATNTKTPSGTGTYDERDVNIVYTGTWVAQSVTGNYANTEKYSSLIGSTAVFTFAGNQVTIKFRKASVFGNMEVWIDGGLVDTVSQTNTTITQNQSWVSPVLTDGTHVIILKHASGMFISLDAIIINDKVSAESTATLAYTPSMSKTPTNTLPATNTKTPSGIGTYDERDGNIVYTGTWVAQSVKGNYANTEKYSTLIGSTAEFTFTGNQLTIFFRKAPSFGNLEVWIDGVLIDTINQTHGSIIQNKSWVSPVFIDETHTIVMKHATGIYVALDAIVVWKVSLLSESLSITETPTILPTFTLIPTSFEPPIHAVTITTAPIFYPTSTPQPNEEPQITPTNTP
jgi:hypothetical protein